MPPRRRPQARKPKVTGRPRRARAVRSYPTFTETFSSTQINSGTGGVFTTSFDEIPQSATYASLYRTFRITKMEVMILPDQNMGIDLSIGATVASSAVGRIAYAINPSADLAPPTSENQVLVDNGCRVYQLSKPLKINCAPQPALQQTGTVVGLPAAVVGVNSTRSNWLDINTGNKVLHNGISYWYSNQFGGLSASTAQVYYRITFMLKDPQ